MASYLQHSASALSAGLQAACPGGLQPVGTTKLDFTASGCDVNSLIRRGTKTRAGQYELDFLTVTLAEKGMAVVKKGERRYASAAARQVFDVSGAGDTVIATLALCLACGVEIEAAMNLANIAAGIVVGKVGTSPIERNELLGRS